MTPADRRAEFAQLYDRVSRDVWAAAYARRPDRESATDATQEAFLRLWQQWQDGEAIEQPRAWLKRVARNVAEDAARSAFRRHGTQNGAALARLPTIDDTKPGPDHTAIVRELLLELPEADREVLVLKYLFDVDAAEIARRLEVSITAVHMRLSRARQRLGERLRQRGVTGQ